MIRRRNKRKNELQQFTELLNAAQTLANTTKSVEEETLDMLFSIFKSVSQKK